MGRLRAWLGGAYLHEFGRPRPHTTGFRPPTVAPGDLKEKPAETVRLLRLAMLVNGVDLSGWPGGLVSAAHGMAEVDETVAAFGESLAMLKRDGVV